MGCERRNIFLIVILTFNMHGNQINSHKIYAPILRWSDADASLVPSISPFRCSVGWISLSQLLIPYGSSISYFFQTTIDPLGVFRLAWGLSHRRSDFPTSFWPPDTQDPQSRLGEDSSHLPMVPIYSVPLREHLFDIEVRWFRCSRPHSHRSTTYSSARISWGGRPPDGDDLLFNP